jgi:hypothetical protein
MALLFEIVGITKPIKISKHETDFDNSGKYASGTNNN